MNIIEEIKRRANLLGFSFKDLQKQAFEATTISKKELDKRKYILSKEPLL